MSGSSAMLTLKPGVTLTEKDVAAAVTKQGLVFESFTARRVRTPAAVWIIPYDGMT